VSPERRILVVDDEPVVRELVAEMLGMAGYDAVATDQVDVLAHLSDETVCLVVSDIRMPGLTGFDLLDLVHERRPGLPVLLVTAQLTDGNVTEASARGAAGVLGKPFSRQELCDAVSVTLEHVAPGPEPGRWRGSDLAVRARSWVRSTDHAGGRE
jgi:DNA-binding NtrC family response regulator